MREIIDVESWGRRDTFNFFKGFVNPIFSITAEVECTGGYKRAKERGESFFIHYLYAILRGLNEIEEFRYRVEQTCPNDPIVVTKYDRVDTRTPITVGNNGEYVELYVPYIADFDTFYKNTTELIANIDSEADPFGCVDENGLGVSCISAIPTLHFTSATQTLKSIGAVNMMPLINVGKMVEHEGVRSMPIAVSVHHGLADGKHMSDLFASIESCLK